MNILFVCTGNTCRSSMAEGIAQHLLSQSGLDHSITVGSAGVNAQDGLSASPEAIAALAEMGMELSGHQARSLTPEILAAADLVLTMTRRHRQEILEIVPAAKSKVFVLKEFIGSRRPAPAGGRPSLDRNLFSEGSQSFLDRSPTASSAGQSAMDDNRAPSAGRHTLNNNPLPFGGQSTLNSNSLPVSNPDIADPYCRPLAAYRAVAQELRTSIQELIEQHLKQDFI